MPVAEDDFATWTELADELEAMTREPSGAPANASREAQKERLLAFAPHRLAVPHRLAQNVEAVTFLVIDVDVLPDVDALVARITHLGIDALMYASPSDVPDARRVRIVAPCSREITPAECRATRYAFAEMLGLEPGQGVEGAHEAAKLFFIGRLHDTPEREIWRFGT